MPRSDRISQKQKNSREYPFFLLPFQFFCQYRHRLRPLSPDCSNRGERKKLKLELKNHEKQIDIYFLSLSLSLSLSLFAYLAFTLLQSSSASQYLHTCLIYPLPHTAQFLPQQSLSAAAAEEEEAVQIMKITTTILVVTVKVGIEFSRQFVTQFENH